MWHYNRFFYLFSTSMVKRLKLSQSNINVTASKIKQKHLGKLNNPDNTIVMWSPFVIGEANTNNRSANYTQTFFFEVKSVKPSVRIIVISHMKLLERVLLLML